MKTTRNNFGTECQWNRSHRPPNHKTNKVNPPHSINQGTPNHPNPTSTQRTPNHQPDQLPRVRPTSSPSPREAQDPWRDPGHRRDPGGTQCPRGTQGPGATKGPGGTQYTGGPRAQEDHSRAQGPGGPRTGVTMVTMLNSPQFCKFEKGTTRKRAQFCNSEKEKNRTAL